MDKLIKIFKCKTMGGHDVCVVGEYLKSTMWLGDVTDKQQGYFITKEQLVVLLETALNNSGAIYDYDIERNLKDLGVE